MFLNIEEVEAKKVSKVKWQLKELYFNVVSLMQNLLSIEWTALSL